MDRDLRFSVPRGSVAHEELEGDVVIVHVVRGHYYSVGASGAQAWIGLAAGASLGEIAAGLETCYDATPERLALEVGSFAERLIAEGLLEHRAAADRDESWSPPDAPAVRAELVPLTWTKFTDLEHLMQLDPVHDVDEAGWPPEA